MKLHQGILLLLFLTVVILVVQQFFLFQKKIEKLRHDSRYNNLDLGEYNKGIKAAKRIYFKRIFSSFLIFIVICLLGVVVNLNIYKFT